MEARVRFGRHPECEVSFDPSRDIDASSRHAELRHLEARGAAGGADADDAPRWVLVDLGSSNGTYVDGHRVTETPVTRNVPVNVEFGPGGPRIRLFVGDEETLANLPPALVERRRPRWLLPAGGALLGVVLLLLILRAC